MTKYFKILIFLLGLFFLLSCKENKPSSFQSIYISSKDLAERELETKYFSPSKFKIEAPINFLQENRDINIPKELKGKVILFKNWDNHSNEKEKTELAVIVQYIAYTPFVKANFYGAYLSAINKIKFDKNLDVLSDDFELINSEYYKGIKFSFIFKHNDIEDEYKNLSACYVSDNKLFSLTTNYRKKDSFADKIANEMIKSIKFDNE